VRARLRMAGNDSKVQNGLLYTVQASLYIICVH
jgi:hypothetical protein